MPNNFSTNTSINIVNKGNLCTTMVRYTVISGLLKNRIKVLFPPVSYLPVSTLHSPLSLFAFCILVSVSSNLSLPLNHTPNFLLYSSPLSLHFVYCIGLFPPTLFFTVTLSFYFPFIVCSTLQSVFDSYISFFLPLYLSIFLYFVYFPLTPLCLSLVSLVSPRLTL
jgi:hypothetical protein